MKWERDSWVTVDSCYVQLLGVKLHTAKQTVEGEEI